MTAVLCFTPFLPVHSSPAISAVACKKLLGKEAPRFVGPLSCATEFNGSNGPTAPWFRANPEGVRERSSLPADALDRRFALARYLPE
jgi:hypothetical protein